MFPFVQCPMSVHSLILSNIVMIFSLLLIIVLLQILLLSYLFTLCIQHFPLCRADLKAQLRLNLVFIFLDLNKSLRASVLYTLVGIGTRPRSPSRTVKKKLYIAVLLCDMDAAKSCSGFTNSSNGDTTSLIYSS